MSELTQGRSAGQWVSVDLDADLVAWVDELVGDGTASLPKLRTQAIEAAVQRWCQQQHQQRLQQLADAHRLRHDNDETGWLV